MGKPLYSHLMAIYGRCPHKAELPCVLPPCKVKKHAPNFRLMENGLPLPDRKTETRMCTLCRQQAVKSGSSLSMKRSTMLTTGAGIRRPSILHLRVITVFLVTVFP